jgi:SAM-dependent methyltransferase
MAEPGGLGDIFRCPACGGEELNAVGPSCAACGLAFAQVGAAPLFVRDAGALAQYLEEARQAKPGWYEQAQFEERASPWRHHQRRRRQYVSAALGRWLAGQNLKQAGRMLDLGCGDGQNLGWLAPFARELHGCDYNPVRLARAGTRPDAPLVFGGELGALPVRAAAYDVVFFNHVLEHIPDDLGALAECLRVLRPGGLMILGAPNEGSWWWQLAYRRSPASLAGTDHVHFYTALTLAEKVRRAGFALREVKGLGFGPPDWAWDMRLRQYKLLDDLFEIFGQMLIPEQCSSLYILATKGG